jgi:uncharacterized short protein YbdD (DUF466 family)
MSLGAVKRAWGFAAQAARLMVGVPDYANYVAHQQSRHPERPVMSHTEFFRERQSARYACEKGRFKGCC